MEFDQLCKLRLFQRRTGQAAAVEPELLRRDAFQAGEDLTEVGRMLVADHPPDIADTNSRFGQQRLSVIVTTARDVLHQRNTAFRVKETVEMSDGNENMSGDIGPAQRVA